MTLTRDFRETIQVRAKGDPLFREALLQEGVECLLTGDMETGKTLLRDYINATIGFEELAAQTRKPSKSLMRMFSAKSNPQANHLFAVIGLLQKKAGVRLEVNTRRQHDEAL